VLRKPQYLESLQAIEDFVAKDNPTAAVDLWLTIDDQVSLLADPNFPRRRGRVSGTLELVAHPNYVVILVQAEDTVTAIDVLHVARQYP
jgi:plasmid stabilization system protein ParE